MKGNGVEGREFENHATSNPYPNHNKNLKKKMIFSINTQIRRVEKKCIGSHEDHT